MTYYNTFQPTNFTSVDLFLCSSTFIKLPTVTIELGAVGGPVQVPIWLS